MGNFHQTTKNRVFQLKLDAVYQYLEGNLDREKPAVLNRDDGHIQRHDDKVDPDELNQNPTREGAGIQVQHLNGCIDVEA